MLLVMIVDFFVDISIMMVAMERVSVKLTVVIFER